jgi:hypothetical protein
LAKSTVFYRDDLTFHYAPLLKAVDIGLAHGAGRNAEQVYYTFFTCIRLFYEVSRSLPAVVKGQPADLVSYLFYAQIFKTSNPSDKIFALYGLMHSSVPDLPRPDYGQDVKDIYRESTAAVLRYSKDLSILEMLHGGRVTEGLVSWVPDWGCESFPALPMVGGEVSGQFHATKSSKAKFSMSDDGLSLIVRGKIIGTVSACALHSSSAVTEGLGDAEEYLTWTQNALPTDPYWRSLLQTYPHCSTFILRLWNIRVLQSFADFARETNLNNGGSDTRTELYETLCSHSSNYSPKRILPELKSWEAWWNTLMQRDPALADPTQTPVSSSKTILKKLKSAITPSPAPYISGGSILATWPSFIRENWNEDTMLLTTEFLIFEEMSKDPAQAEIQAMLQSSLKYQTLFRTEEGNLGMVCNGVKVGDRILLVAGVSTPFVVRGEAGGFEVIGPAFVRGVMEGEAWGRWGSSGEELVDVVLI